MRNLETKADIRKRILTIRKSQSLEEQKKRSQKIQEQVLEHKNFCVASLIFLYMDCQAEVQTGFLLRQCWELGKRVVLPRVEGTEMEFYEVRSLEEVQPGAFGILEPIPLRNVEENGGFMVVPGVAFSKDGYRIGYGKGFYDRYLYRFPGIYTCGLAYVCQMLEQLPIEKHDRKLKEIIYA